MFDKKIFFYGVVENNVDPSKQGRVQVRFHGLHSEDKLQDDMKGIPTADLQWATLMLPTTEAGNSGLGDSATGILQGTWVVGIFRDKAQQSPIIIGTLPSSSQAVSDTSKGFNDPAGVYPLADRIGESDVNRLARNEMIEQTIVQTKRDNLMTGVKKAGDAGEWSEPVTPYAAVYPHNKVNESPSGHITEVDDTPGSERLHTWHKSGTFKETHPDGTTVEKIVKDRFTIIIGDENIAVEGECNITAVGNVNIFGSGTVNIDATADMHLRATGDMTFQAANITAHADSAMKIKGATIDHQSTGAMNIDAGAAMNVKAGAAMAIQAGAAMTLDAMTIGLNNGGSAAPASVVKPQGDITPYAFGDYNTAVSRQVLVQTTGSQHAPTDDADHEKVPDEKPEVPVATGISECGLTVTTPLDYELVLAGPFKLKNFTRTSLYKHELVAQGRRNEQQIICNLKALCVNILVPLQAAHPGFSINSGFRKPSAKSQHTKGMACDIVWPGMPVQQMFDIAVWVKANLPFDQMIWEHGSSVWLHLSYNGESASQRKSVLTFKNSQYKPGLTYYTGFPAPNGGGSPIF